MGVVTSTLAHRSCPSGMGKAATISRLVGYRNQLSLRSIASGTRFGAYNDRLGNDHLKRKFSTNNNSNDDEKESCKQWMKESGIENHWDTVDLSWEVYVGLAESGKGDAIEKHLIKQWPGKTEHAKSVAQWFSDKYKAIEFDSLSDFYDWVDTVVMENKESKLLEFDYQFEKCVYGWNDNYLDDKYRKLLKQAHDDWHEFIQKPKLQHKSDGSIRDETFCVYGIPGSGKSRFLMELRDWLLLNNENGVYPIAITFNDKCDYGHREDVSETLFWKEIICRVAFSLCGDNDHNTFLTIRSKANSIDSQTSFLPEMTWDTFVRNTLNYINSNQDISKGKNYQGIVLLVDEILKTGNNQVEMHGTFTNQFHAAWDSHTLTRKDLSFIFTTLNSYSWIQDSTASGRRINTYYLPHFEDRTIREQLPKNSKNDKNSVKLLFAATLVNFVPRYLRDILNNFAQNDKIEAFNKSNKMNEELLRIGDDVWRQLRPKLKKRINENIFNLTFTNDICQYNDVAKGSLRYCDLVVQGVVIPYKDESEGSEDKEFSTEFIPQISLLPILLYLDELKDRTNLQDKLFNVMKTFVTNGNSFEQFHLLFETFRYNAMNCHKNKETTTFGKMFSGLFFCNTNAKCRKKYISFDNEKTLFDERESFDELMMYLNSLNENDRNDYLLTTVVWFGGDRRHQAGFDSLIVYPTQDNQFIWLFLESKYLQAKDNDSMTDIGGTKLRKKVINFNANLQKHNNLYCWFNKDMKFLAYCDYKNIHSSKLESKKNDSIFENVGIWTESIDKNEATHSTHRLTDHFGPTWKHILSHYIAVKYRQTSIETKLIKKSKKSKKTDTN